MLLFSNNAETTLAQALPGDSEHPDYNTITASADGSADTLRYVDAEEGHVQLATLTHPSMPDVLEVVEVVGRTGTVFTVKRDVENVPGRSWLDPAPSWPAGTKMSARVTAATLGRFLQVDHRRFVDVTTMGGGRISFRSTPVVRNARSKVTSGPGWTREPLDRNFGVEVIGCTDFVDLGEAPAWGANEYYYLGAVVVPSTADGHQYWFDPLDDGLYSQDIDEPGFAGLSGVTEAWKDGDPPEQVGYWVATSLPVSVSQMFDAGLIVSEVGFVTSRVGAEAVTATSAPVVSIGTSANPTRFVSSGSLTHISGADEDNWQFQRFPISEPGGALVRDLRFKVETAATGGSFLGRFYWRGFFIEID